MVVDSRLLVIVDDSVASKRAVRYVGKFVGKRRGFRIRLVHVLPSLPPELLEYGGSNPAGEACWRLTLTSPTFCTTASERVYITTSSGKDANGGLQGAEGDRRAAICGANVVGAGGL